LGFNKPGRIKEERKMETASSQLLFVHLLNDMGKEKTTEKNKPQWRLERYF
jgi:hypothetical protein